MQRILIFGMIVSSATVNVVEINLTKTYSLVSKHLSGSKMLKCIVASI